MLNGCRGVRRVWGVMGDRGGGRRGGQRDAPGQDGYWPMAGFVQPGKRHFSGQMVTAPQPQSLYTSASLKRLCEKEK